jgi:hypothetical protein
MLGHQYSAAGGQLDFVRGVFMLWQQEGCPEGRADEYWHRTREFETY